MKYRDFTVNLCNDRSTDTWINLDAKLKDGCLTFEGQDIGAMPQEFFDKDEYEYWYSFDKQNTAKLMKSICRFYQNPSKALFKYFSGKEGCQKLREICTERGIQYEFFSC